MWLSQFLQRMTWFIEWYICPLYINELKRLNRTPWNDILLRKPCAKWTWCNDMRVQEKKRKTSGLMRHFRQFFSRFFSSMLPGEVFWSWSLRFRSVSPDSPWYFREEVLPRWDSSQGHERQPGLSRGVLQAKHEFGFRKRSFSYYYVSHYARSGCFKLYPRLFLVILYIVIYYSRSMKAAVSSIYNI